MKVLINLWYHDHLWIFWHRHVLNHIMIVNNFVCTYRKMVIDADEGDCEKLHEHTACASDTL